MSNKTKPASAITRTELDQKIEELTKQRDRFVENANMQIVSLNSQIEILSTLLDPPEDELEITSEIIE